MVELVLLWRAIPGKAESFKPVLGGVHIALKYLIRVSGAQIKPSRFLVKDYGDFLWIYEDKIDG